MNYYKKYIKYKNKYFNLKNIKGGTESKVELSKPITTSKLFSIDNFLPIDKLLLVPNFIENLNMEIYLNKLKYFEERSKGIINIYKKLKEKDPNNENYIRIDINEMEKYITYIHTLLTDKISKLKLMLVNNLVKGNIFSDLQLYMYIIVFLYNMCINNIMKEINKLETNFIYSNIDWFNFDYPKLLNEKIKLYILREYIVGIILCFANIIYDILIDSKIYSCSKIECTDKPNNLPTEFNFKISGSAELLSDIDINIHAQYNLALAMSIVENLTETIIWFNHTKWRVDFYGDITYLYSLKDNKQIKEYIKINNDNGDMLKTLLKYVYVGCLKINTCNLSREKITSTIESIMKTTTLDEAELSSIFNDGDKLNEDYSRCLNEEHEYRINRIKEFDKSNELKDVKLKPIYKSDFREKYYKFLSTVDEDCIKYTNDKKDINALKIYEDMAMANVYREENYMLIGTVINIVNCTQDKTDPTDTLCNLTYDTYILSIIEQFGFMIHYIYNDCENTDICNLQANKYFERILYILSKILNMSELKDKFDKDSKEYKSLKITIDEYKTTSELITIIKKERSSQSNKDKDCGKYEFKILEFFDKIMELFNKIMEPIK